MSLKIFYLDQNFISNFAKARLGLMREEQPRELWKKLGDFFIKLREDRKIICPYSFVHLQETAQIEEPKLKKEIYSWMFYLSAGVRFATETDIENKEVENELYAFLGKPLKHKNWEIYFEENPQEAKASFKKFVDLKNLSSFFSKEKEIKHKEDSIRQVQEIRKELLDYDHYKQREQTAFVNYRYKIPAGKVEMEKMRREYGLPSDFFNLWYEKDKEDFKKGELVPLGSLVVKDMVENGITQSDLDRYDFFQKIHDLWKSEKSGMFDEFFDSPGIRKAPVTKIFAELCAEIFKKQNERTFKEGDFYDIRVLAFAIPACEVVCCDHFFKLQCEQKDYGKLYNTTLFSAKKESLEALYKHLEKL